MSSEESVDCLILVVSASRARARSARARTREWQGARKWPGRWNEWGRRRTGRIERVEGGVGRMEDVIAGNRMK